MGDFVTIGILILILAAAGIVLLRRRGRKGCCGSGSDYKPKKKKLHRVIATRVFAVSQMHCEKCANRVTEVINDIPHLAGMVDLKAGTLTVSYEEMVEDDLILTRLERAGYPARLAE